MTRKELIAKAEAWFDTQGWKPFPFQKKAWNAYLQGKSGLLNAPTGCGKTYALWTPIVLESIRQSQLKSKKPKKGLRALWITPLRSLSAEIELTTSKLAREMDTPLRVEVRNGDTPTSVRNRQKKSMPDLLITTPESLHLLLASKGYPKMFKNLEAVIVDEWHELLGSKRGVQVELALSRLKTITQKLRIWGISATIGNLQQAQEVLLGPESEELKNSVLIQAKSRKKIRVRSVIPAKIERFPWRGHLGMHLLDQLVPILRESNSTLIFTNTRSQCELWFRELLERYPEFAGVLAMHHGSIEKKTRLWVENAIREGKLKAVVCTSSLDLGVDFAPVDTIVQIGSPKGVARFIQRAGRSGHQPGGVSNIWFLPTHALELVEASALQHAVKNTSVEDRVPYMLSYDTLVQYLTTLAISEGFYSDALYEEVRQTHCFQSLTPKDWHWLLNFLTNGSQSLEAYDEYRKLEIEEDGRFVVTSRQIAMRHRMQIGTIVSDEVLRVRYMRGGNLGTIEEWFVSKLKKGDVFTFAGRNLELFRIEQMDVLVKKSKKKNAKVVSWMGGRMSFSAYMSHLLREELYQYQTRPQQTEELTALYPLFEQQQRESIVPQNHQFLIETFQTREGYHAVFYPFEGRFVHEAMASLLAWRISLLKPITFTIALNDYGFELLSNQEVDIPLILDNDLFTPEQLAEDLPQCINATEMARRKFRDIAVISGLVFTGMPGRKQKVRHLQSGTQLLFNVFRDYEPDNLLFRQAFAETFEHQLEEGRLFEALERIAGQEKVWRQCSKPTPLSFPIITDRLRGKLSSEKLSDRIKRMTLALEK